MSKAEDYLKKNIKGILHSLVVEIMKKTPSNPVRIEIIFDNIILNLFYIDIIHDSIFRKKL